MVCLGNICRSPMAEHVLRRKIKESGLDVTVVSGGTASWHVGKEAHPRTQKVLNENGYTSDHSAKQVSSSWFSEFDYLLVMDKTNLSDIKEFARDLEGMKKVSLLRDFDPNSQKGSEVPDPYYGTAADFQYVYDLLDRATAAFISQLQKQTN